MTIRTMTTDWSANSDLPAGVKERRAPGRIRLTKEQRDALAFLRAPARGAAKILVGEPGTGKTTLLDKYCSELQHTTVLRSRGGTGSVESLIDALLESVGFRATEPSYSGRIRLLLVFMERQKTKGRKVLIAVDGAEQLSSDSWAELEHLHEIQLDDDNDLALIISGEPSIYKHIRSPIEGWHCARTRFHTLTLPNVPTLTDVVKELPASTLEPTGFEGLIVNLNGQVDDRVPLGERTMIGRNAHNDVCLNDPEVSRHHAVIVDTESGYYVVDLNSKNGLKLNGETVSNAILGNNDVLSIGRYRIKVAITPSERCGDPRPPAGSLSATATLRVKTLSERVQRNLRSVKNSQS